MYDLALISYGIAWFHFVSEFIVFGTAGLQGAASPFIVSSEYPSISVNPPERSTDAGISLLSDLASSLFWMLKRESLSPILSKPRSENTRICFLTSSSMSQSTTFMFPPREKNERVNSVDRENWNINHCGKRGPALQSRCGLREKLSLESQFRT